MRLALLSLLFISVTTTPTSAVSFYQRYAQQSEPEASPAKSHDDADTIQARITRRENPMAVRKMSEDEGEKFWLEYWKFESLEAYEQGDGDLKEKHGSKRDVFRQRGVLHGSVEMGELGVNTSLLTPAFSLHAAEYDQERTLSRPWVFARSLFSPAYNKKRKEKRNFKCPADTSPCTSIKRPNSCCGTGDRCQWIEDTGLGDVGCCGSQDDCVGNGVRDCPDGYSSCPENSGGGCCIPGYQCADEGCIFISTLTITPSPTTTTATSPPSSSTPAPSTFLPPVRPTSNPPSSPSPSSSPTPTPTPSHPTSSTTPPPPSPTACPTGFYPCLAVYRGGCCRTGRDCNTTSCPPPDPSTTLISNGATIVIPISPTGGSRCAQGWELCSPDVGGGCCPAGFGCGAESCTGTATGTGNPTGTVAKEPAENNSAHGPSMAVLVLVPGLVGSHVAIAVAAMVAGFICFLPF
ncbi:hypothetical protein AJ80_06753 [Polytolypa hystricis UAMH7299]|uniref:GPI anchored protein n=1 Tax=Polytolypa hystricis (strain UAMH7299) TaxID=1447883 RepID=A0A2B7XUA0_POLH7|nr:hypothetical protein AJ80_06753 [Polytolypa hystricis UAMH7299]